MRSTLKSLSRAAELLVCRSLQCRCSAFSLKMNFNDAKSEILQILSKTEKSHLPKLLQWLKSSDDLDDVLVDNESVILKSIADDLRACLPLEAMASSEVMAIQKTQQKPHPTVHVDAFLYDDETVDVLCEEGKMSRNYCVSCGSHRTEPLEFISHSFSIPELRFLFHNVLPDLTGKVLVDVGSRLGAVLYAGYLYTAASRLVGVEISSDFVNLQAMTVEKYGFSDRIQVVHADIRSQAALLQNADVLIMNNVFEFFMETSDQMHAWQFVTETFRRSGALLVTVPGLHQSLSALPGSPHPEIVSKWVEEVQIDLSACLEDDGDRDSLKEIHLYRVL